jgi:hypothetical protein
MFILLLFLTRFGCVAESDNVKVGGDQIADGDLTRKVAIQVLDNHDRIKG